MLVIIVTGPPVIVTHPTNGVISAKEIITLNCKATGGGSITYLWQFSVVDGGQWISIMDSSTEKFIVRNLRQSERYRCIVSNEAGNTISNASTVTLMGKLFISIDLYYLDTYMF